MYDIHVCGRLYEFVEYSNFVVNALTTSKGLKTKYLVFTFKQESYLYIYTLLCLIFIEISL